MVRVHHVIFLRNRLIGHYRQKRWLLNRSPAPLSGLSFITTLVGRLSDKQVIKTPLPGFSARVCSDVSPESGGMWWIAFELARVLAAW